MKAYNMDFLIAALVFLCFIWYHFRKQKKLNNARNRVFEFFIAIGILDIIFDMISTVLMENTDLTTVFAAKTSLTLLYLVQMGLLAAFFCYIQTFRSFTEQQMKKAMMICSVPCAVYIILILLNLSNGMFFFFEPGGEYSRGPFYLMTYLFALGYMLLILFYMIIFRKEVGKKRLVILLEFVLILSTNVVLQAVMEGTLMIGFGIALGITVMYMTTSNPYGYVDSLTGTFDKNSLAQWIQDAIERGESMNMIAVDMFRLKAINKIYGDRVGDQLLITASQKLMQLGTGANIFRVTGNRFLVVFDSAVDYSKAKSDFTVLFEHEFVIGIERISCPAIICGITNAQALKNCDTMLSYVEYMVSLVKDTQKTVVIQSNGDTLKGFQYAQDVEVFLNSAIEKNLFEVYYQPVYSCDSGKYVSLEALSRLQHPVLGQISPEIFINIAEKNGSITQIGLMQFERVCRFVKEHKAEMPDIKNIKFNLSPVELLKEGHAKRLVRLIDKYELDGSFFQFEITETVATEYSEVMMNAVSVFSQAGIGLCLDDFGSGYANLNTVLKLPFLSIKIDRSLLFGISKDRQIATFYKSIVSILQNIGFHIISEGVEAQEEVQLLRSWGVDMIQGFYFSKPLNEQDIIKKINE